MKSDYEILSSLLDYNSNTGVLRWEAKPCNRSPVNIGDVAGTQTMSSRYSSINVYGKQYSAHRVAWLLYYGEWPKDQIDHINLNKKDNRIENLRECTNSENRQNRKIQVNNTSGYTGVFWDKSREKWSAILGIGYKRKNLGRFLNKEDAYAAYLDAKKQFHTFQPTMPSG